MSIETFGHFSKDFKCSLLKSKSLEDLLKDSSQIFNNFGSYIFNSSMMVLARNIKIPLFHKVFESFIRFFAFSIFGFSINFNIGREVFIFFLLHNLFGYIQIQ